jgi:hypothetical protein
MLNGGGRRVVVGTFNIQHSTFNGAKASEGVCASQHSTFNIQH